jgi:peroxiredoxin
MAAVWLWIAVELLLLGLLAAWVLLVQLLGQQGRLLLRLEQLEDQLSLEGHSRDEDEAQGLPVGAPLPSFRLPDLAGQPVALEDYRGRRVLLVQWSPSCSFCEQLAPELADLQIQLPAHQIEPVLVSDGDAKANRRLAHRYGLDSPILLQPDDGQVAAFKGQGTDLQDADLPDLQVGSVRTQARDYLGRLLDIDGQMAELQQARTTIKAELADLNDPEAERRTTALTTLIRR